ncbi:MAG: SpoIIE family protein phosphatase [Clostridia bacterium]|nr:SpoIIE family protein phosphatase [Clostridia bacterium]
MKGTSFSDTRADKVHGAVRRATPAPRFERGRLRAARSAEGGGLLSAVKSGAGLLFTFLTGVIFSRTELIFSAYPFGCALLCAAERYLPSIALGVFFGYFSLGGDYSYPALSVLILASRLVISLYGQARKTGQSAFFAPPASKVYISAVGSFLCGIYNIVRHGYRYYDLFGSLVLLLVCPLLTCLFSWSVSRSENKRASMKILTSGVFFASLVYCLRELAVLGVSLSGVLSFFVTTVVARKKGITLGTVTGFVLGFAADPALVYAYALSGFLAGALKKALPYVSVSLVLGITSFAAFWVSKSEGLILVLPAMAIGTISAFFAESLSSLNFVDRIFENDEPECVSAASAASCEERIEALSKSFVSLSEMCYQLSDRYRRPDRAELAGVCSNVCDKYCKRCRTSPLCWNREYSSTADVVGKMVSSLSEGKKISKNNIPKYFSVRCPSVDAIIKEINTECAALARKKLENNGTRALAMDYEAVAALIFRALEKSKKEEEINEKLSLRAQSAFKESFASQMHVTVRGERCIKIDASGKSSKEPTSLEILKLRLEAVCGRRLDMPVCSQRDGFLSISAKAVRMYGAEVAFLSLSKDKNTECGDRVSVFENREDYFYSMISDGMGSGSEAALTSGICSAFLKRMLSAGNSKDISIEMLNDLLRSTHRESSASVDLFELDMITGRASFVKSGAAPSFVKRKGKLFRIQSKTLPVGIVRSADAEQVSFDAEAGDIIVLQSDGVAESYEDCPWLVKLLTRSYTDDLREMCARILTEAERHSGSNDDRSVCIIKIVDIKK